MLAAGARLVERWYRIVIILLSLSVYTAMAPFGYGLFALLAGIPSRAPERRRALLQGIVRRAFAFLHGWAHYLRVLRLHAGGLRLALPSGPLVVIANHPSLTDTTAIMSIVPGVCCVVKHQVFSKPWLRPLLTDCGHFSAGEPNLLGGKEARDMAVSRLKAGHRLLLFPEGTRSPRGGLQPITRSAFEIACRAGVPVVAVFIAERPTWLAKGDRLFGPPASVPVKRLEVLKILHPEDFCGDSREMRDYARALYERALADVEDRADSPSVPARPDSRLPRK